MSPIRFGRKCFSQTFARSTCDLLALIVLVVTLLMFCTPFVFASDPPVAEFTPPPKSVEGLFLGHIYWVSQPQKAIVVTPNGNRGARKRFYFDSATKFLQDKVQLGLHELEPGDKVAIWYIGEGKTLLADKIYYVDGEFERDKYLPKSRRVSPADQEIPSVKKMKPTPAAENAEKDADQ